MGHAHTVVFRRLARPGAEVTDVREHIREGLTHQDSKCQGRIPAVSAMPLLAERRQGETPADTGSAFVGRPEAATSVYLMGLERAQARRGP